MVVQYLEDNYLWPGKNGPPLGLSAGLAPPKK